MSNYISVEIKETKEGEVIVIFYDEYASGFFKFDNIGQFEAQFPSEADIAAEILKDKNFEDCEGLPILFIN